MIGNRCRSQQKTGFRVADPGGESRRRHEGAAGGTLPVLLEAKI